MDENKYQNSDETEYVFNTWEVLKIFQETKGNKKMEFESKSSNGAIFTLTRESNTNVRVCCNIGDENDILLLEYWDLNWKMILQPVSFLEVLAIGTWFSASHPLLTKKLGTESDEYLPVDFFIELSYFSSKDRLDIMTKGQFYIIDREN